MRMETKATGFASPTQGYEEQGIDLNRLLIRNPPATYFVRLETGEMTALGLPKGALLIVDRSKSPGAGLFVLIRHAGQFLCRQMAQSNGKTTFTNGTDHIYPIPDDTEIIGVISASIQTYNASGGMEAAVSNALAGVFSQEKIPKPKNAGEDIFQQ